MGYYTGKLMGVQAVSGDADAQAFITATGISDSTQISAVNTLVASLKSYGLWTKMKAIYPFVGGTETTHKFNLKDARDLDEAFRLTFSGALTHSSGGVLGGGGKAITYLSQSVHLGQNDLHFSVYSRSNVAPNYTVSMGNAFGNGFNQSNLWIRTPEGTYMRANSINTPVITTNSDTRGYYIVNRVSSTEIRCQRNNTLLTQTIASTTNNISAYFTIFAADSEGKYPDNKQLAFSTIGLGLTDSDMSNLYTIVQAFQTTLGREV